MQMEEIGREEGLWNPQIRQTHDWWIQLPPHPGVCSCTLPFLLSLAFSAKAAFSDVVLTEMEIFSHLYLEVPWLLLGEAGSSSQGWESLAQLHAPGSSSIQTELTFPADTHTQGAQLHTTNSHIYKFTHVPKAWTLRLQTHREHTRTQ